MRYYIFAKHDSDGRRPYAFLDALDQFIVVVAAIVVIVLLCTIVIREVGTRTLHRMADKATSLSDLYYEDFNSLEGYFFRLKDSYGLMNVELQHDICMVYGHGYTCSEYIRCDDKKQTLNCNVLNERSYRLAFQRKKVGKVEHVVLTKASVPYRDISLNELYQHEFDYDGASYFRMHPEYRGLENDRPVCQKQLGDTCNEYLMCTDRSFELCITSKDREWYEHRKIMSRKQ